MNREEQLCPCCGQSGNIIDALADAIIKEHSEFIRQEQMPDEWEENNGKTG